MQLPSRPALNFGRGGAAPLVRGGAKIPGILGTMTMSARPPYAPTPRLACEFMRTETGCGQDIIGQKPSRKKTGNMRSISDYMECRSMTAHCAPIILAAAQNDVPAVYGDSVFARDGGLLSYGPDLVDAWRRA